MLICFLIYVLGLVSITCCAMICHILDRNATVPPSYQAATSEGMKKKVAKSFPKLTHATNDDKIGKLADWAICLSESTAGSKFQVLSQGDHGFHVTCIDKWLEFTPLVARFLW
ncbi:RING-H2 finger ATL8-like [Olea europaea subsp. europaea]|uniref:RING-type E3 ubiquitin transferase n=1 Tax=Olea europaea subsp. europaea TaxID=158383 RepID=A0A8S0PXW1_OLEEU|nr:RING-H2 finger ATL8-like [Olea europaea subsp. europaea]